MPNNRGSKRAFGSIRKLPSGRFQARYLGPDGRQYAAKRSNGDPLTFDTKGDAEGWLSLRHSEVLRGEWLPAPKPTVTFAAYAGSWLAARELAPRTRELYRRLLTNHIEPRFGTVALGAITKSDVRAWHAGLTCGRTAKSHAYQLLRTICGTAVVDDLIPSNPCQIRGAGSTKRARKVTVATATEVATLAAAMPSRFRLMVLLAAYAGPRFGEMAELRRGDIDATNGVLRIRRGVVRVTGARLVKGPKSDAGVRDVVIPPHVMPAVRAHLSEHTQPGRDGLLFPAASGVQLNESTFRRHWYAARTKASRPDLRFHDLRHTANMAAAAAGADLPTLMARMGHSSTGAALVYLHTAAEQDRAVAERMSELATGTANVVPIKSKRRRKSG
ncbi:tyrosine-type recombinase/integrase [Pseudonocardia sp. Cha107L01]|uniref:tyrosine-type recombinase/integrase n=1 Tax=Pseudonocardia sp. Cha107L01 TaxID=3457576 RepID=UPI00403E9D68